MQKHKKEPAKHGTRREPASVSITPHIKQLQRKPAQKCKALFSQLDDQDSIARDLAKVKRSELLE